MRKGVSVAYVIVKAGEQNARDSEEIKGMTVKKLSVTAEKLLLTVKKMVATVEKLLLTMKKQGVTVKKAG